MNMRALLVAALSLSMIRVTLPGSDLVCARHGSPRADVAHVSGGLANAHHDHPGRHQPGPQPPSDPPSRSECCQALASCGMSLALPAEYSVVASTQNFRRAETLRLQCYFRASPLPNRLLR